MQEIKMYESIEDQPIEHAEVRLIEDQIPILQLLKHGANILAIVLSLVQNQAISIMMILMGIGKMNFFVSIIFGLCIGQVSYMLAKRSYKEIQDRTHLHVPKMLSFIDDFFVSVASLKYSLFLNIAYFIVAFIIQKIS